MRRLLLTLIALLVACVATAQERHYYYEYSHSNYYNDSDVSPNMNLRSTVKLPAQFTLSINSDHKLLWLDSPSREEKFEAGNHTSDYYFYHYTHWTESRFWGMMMEPELSEDDITIRMNRSYSVVTVHYIELLDNEMFRQRMEETDMFHTTITHQYPHSISMPDHDNGRINTEKAMRLNIWRESYPAIAWCVAKGEGWYLPANEELQGLLSAKERINHCLLQVGGDDLYHRYYNRSYWTSTEMDRKTVGVAIFYGDNDADVEISEKVNPYIRARAVRRF